MGIADWGEVEWGLAAFNLVALFIIIRFLKRRLTTKLAEVEDRQAQSLERRNDER